jgi:hypothetical protein
MAKKQCTSVVINNFCSRARAEKLAELLANTLQNSYIQPYIGVCPVGGSFDVNVTTNYVFQNENGNDSDDQVGELKSFVLAVLADCLAFRL